jgi:hypothetical protein
MTVEFKFSCPHCGQHIAATAEFIGAQINCPTCSRPFEVPSPSLAGKLDARSTQELTERLEPVASISDSTTTSQGTSSAAAPLFQNSIGQRVRTTVMNPKVVIAILSSAVFVLLVALTVLFSVRREPSQSRAAYNPDAGIDYRRVLRDYDSQPPPRSISGASSPEELRNSPLYREENAADRADAVNKRELHKDDPNPWLRALKDAR